MSVVVLQAQQYLARVLQTQGLAPPLGSSLSVTAYNTPEAHRRPDVLDWAAVQAQYDHEQFLRDGVQVCSEPTGNSGWARACRRDTLSLLLGSSQPSTRARASDATRQRDTRQRDTRHQN